MSDNNDMEEGELSDQGEEVSAIRGEQKEALGKNNGDEIKVTFANQSRDLPVRKQKKNRNQQIRPKFCLLS